MINKMLIGNRTVRFYNQIISYIKKKYMRRILIKIKTVLIRLQIFYFFLSK